MSRKVGILIEMVDAAGHVFWSERTIEAEKGYVVRYGPVGVDYQLGPEVPSSKGPRAAIVKGTFTGYLKVTVEDVPDE